MECSFREISLLFQLNALNMYTIQGQILPSTETTRSTETTFCIKCQINSNIVTCDNIIIYYLGIVRHCIYHSIMVFYVNIFLCVRKALYGDYIILSHIDMVIFKSVQRISFNRLVLFFFFSVWTPLWTCKRTKNMLFFE